jgi:hypothetical protein
LLFHRSAAILAAMIESTPPLATAAPAGLLPPETALAVADGPPPVTPGGQAALAAAQALARKATAAATLRAYQADWTHYAAWCATNGFVAVPAAPATVGAYLASLAGSHAPTTIRRRLSALGKMHRFNDLPWNPGHHAARGHRELTSVLPTEHLIALGCVAVLYQQHSL